MSKTHKNISFKYDIDASNDWFVKIVISHEGGITSDYPDIMLLLVSAAKLMVGTTPSCGYSYHSFLLSETGLTITIEDPTRHRLQNATKVAKHLERVYKVIMSHYGCGNGLKR